MIISRKIYVSRILTGTWRSSLYVAVTCTIAYVVNNYLLKGSFELPVVVPTILGTALAFFIGFNNNQAYDRWWEGRKIWGALVNDSRTWARQIMEYTSVTDKVDEAELYKLKKKSIHRHIAFLYALKENLRDCNDGEYKKYLSEDELTSIEQKSNKQNAILDIQTKELQGFYSEGIVDGFKFMEMNKNITRFSDEMGKAERIKNTVFPTTYSYYTNLFIWFFIISITLETANVVGAWSVVIGMFLGYVFMTTHLIGRSLLNPFDQIIAGNPLDQITRTIEINLLETLGEKDIPKPIEAVDEEYII